MKQETVNLMPTYERPLEGCYELTPVIHKDARGQFVKVFQDDIFVNLGLNTDYVEEYYSVSKRGVIRGLHFQLPPFEHVKLVYCVQGHVQDVIVDLRVGSPGYGQFSIVELSQEKGNMLYIPAGCAHGFCVLSDSATLVYKVSSKYSAEHDKGILWDSLNILWDTKKPILSARDQLLPKFDDFSSPFVYKSMP